MLENNNGALPLSPGYNKVEQTCHSIFQERPFPCSARFGWEGLVFSGRCIIGGGTLLAGNTLVCICTTLAGIDGATTRSYLHNLKIYRSGVNPRRNDGTHASVRFRQRAKSHPSASRLVYSFF